MFFIIWLIGGTAFILLYTIYVLFVYLKWGMHTSGHRNRPTWAKTIYNDGYYLDFNDVVINFLCSLLVAILFPIIVVTVVPAFILLKVYNRIELTNKRKRDRMSEMEE